MPVLVLEEVFRSMEEHVLSTYPEEGCGLLIGEVSSDFGEPDCDIRVSEIRPLQNAWGDGEKTRRYQIDPDAIAHAEREFLDKPYGILGIYHSHPDAPARPSPFDLERAWPCYAYIILSVRRGTGPGGPSATPHKEVCWGVSKITEATAWRLAGDVREFREQKLKKVRESLPCEGWIEGYSPRIAAHTAKGGT